MIGVSLTHENPNPLPRPSARSRWSGSISVFRDGFFFGKFRVEQDSFDFTDVFPLIEFGGEYETGHGHDFIAGGVGCCDAHEGPAHEVVFRTPQAASDHG